MSGGLRGSEPDGVGYGGLQGSGPDDGPGTGLGGVAGGLEIGLDGDDVRVTEPVITNMNVFKIHTKLLFLFIFIDCPITLQYEDLLRTELYPLYLVWSLSYPCIPDYSLPDDVVLETVLSMYP